MHQIIKLYHHLLYLYNLDFKSICNQVEKEQLYQVFHTLTECIPALLMQVFVLVVMLVSVLCTLNSTAVQSSWHDEPVLWNKKTYIMLNAMNLDIVLTT